MFMPTIADEIVFSGNTTICSNKTAARRLVLEAPMPETGERDWYELWIGSAFLATLLVKVAVANFGLSLMELADPFVVCAGEYLGLPVASSSINENKDKLWASVLKSKRRSLFVASLSRVVCWGFVMHACLFNMFAAVYDGTNSSTTTSVELAIEQRDKNVLAGCLAFAVAVALTGAYVIRGLQESVQERKTRRQSELEATDEDELENNDSGHENDEAGSSDGRQNGASLFQSEPCVADDFIEEEMVEAEDSTAMILH